MKTGQGIKIGRLSGYLGNINIKNKLMLLLALPLAGLLFFSVVELKNSFMIWREMNTLQTLSELAVRISALVHETQKERGMTAGFIGSRGKDFASELSSQRTETDKKISDLKTALKDFNAGRFGAELKSSLDQAMSKIENIKGIRDSVSSMNISAADAIAYYTSANSLFLDAIAGIASLSTDRDVARRLTAYVGFLQAKERAGIERAVLSNTFALNKFGPGMIEKFVSLIAAQDSYTGTFLSLSTTEEKRFYNEKMSGQIIETTKKMRNTALEKSGAGNFGINPEEWFKAQTAKINLMKEVEDKQSKDLQAYAGSLKAKAQTALILILVLISAAGSATAALAYLITRSMTQSMNEAVTAASRLAEGDLTGSIEATTKDEIGMLLSAMRNMAARIKAIADDINVVIAAAVEGKLDTRSDASKHKGDFGRIIEGLNKTLDAVVGPLKVSAEYVEKISKGDLPPKITAEYKGDFNEIKNNLNTLIDSMNMVSSIAEEIAGGNLTIEVKKRSEQDMLMAALDAMVKGLTNIALNVKNATDQVSTAADQIAEANQNFSQRITEQASSIEETSATMEEMSASIKHTADNAREANKLAQTAKTSAESGSSVMQNTIDAMAEINKSSSKIGNISNVIEEIAFQTNLLALNAAVEAARAGEHGKGFAVVASEIRNLAQRASQSAKEITSLIEDSSEKTERGVALANELSMKLDEIGTNVKKVTDLMDEVAAAAGEQASGINQVNSAVSQIDQTTQQNAALVEETAASAEELAGQAKELLSLISFFKVDAVRAFERKTKEPTVHEIGVVRHIEPRRTAQKRFQPALAAAPVGTGAFKGTDERPNGGFEEF
jgi:methyl-accepting chemotaxis protein